MSGMGIPIIGGILGAGGSLAEASDKASAYEDQAFELEQNAKLTRAAAKYNAMRQEMIAMKKIGSAQTSYAASGVSADSGSVLDVLAASRANAEMDRLSIVYAGDVRAASMEERARYDRSAADQSRQMGYYNAFTSVFTGTAESGTMSGPDKDSRTDPNPSYGGGSGRNSSYEDGGSGTPWGYA